MSQIEKISINQITEKICADIFNDEFYIKPKPASLYKAFETYNFSDWEINNMKSSLLTALTIISQLLQNQMYYDISIFDQFQSKIELDYLSSFSHNMVEGDDDQPEHRNLLFFFEYNDIRDILFPLMLAQIRNQETVL